MRILINFLIILSSTYIFGQDSFEKYFDNLEIADSISDKKIISYYQSKSQFKKDDFFIYDGQLKNQLLDNSFLFKKNKTGFIIFVLPFQNSSGIEFSKNKNYLLLKVEHNSSARQVRVDTQEQIIVDLVSLSYISLSTYNSEQSWEFDDAENMIVHNRKCKSLISIENKYLTVFSLCYEDDHFTNECEECFPTGVYEIQDNKLRKVKSYSEESLSMNNIEWIDSFYLGMTIENFFEKNKFKVEEKPLFIYGYDSEDIGYEIIKNKSPEYFLVVIDKIITSAFIMTNEINIEGINTTWTIKKVFEKFPNSKLHIDLISHWEYIYLRDKNLRLIFKTDNSNRIGIYGNDFEEGSSKLKKENKTIDLIQVMSKPSS
jgi:hypothetical protein